MAAPLRLSTLAQTSSNLGLDSAPFGCSFLDVAFLTARISQLWRTFLPNKLQPNTIWHQVSELCACTIVLSSTIYIKQLQHILYASQHGISPRAARATQIVKRAERIQTLVNQTAALLWLNFEMNHGKSCGPRSERATIWQTCIPSVRPDEGAICVSGITVDPTLQLINRNSLKPEKKKDLRII